MILRHQFLEVLLNLLGSCGLREFEPLAEASHVGINDHANIDLEGVSKDNVGSLPPNTCQRSEIFHRPRNLTVVFITESLAACFDVLGLAAEEADSANPLLKLGEGGLGKCFSGSILLNEDFHYVDRIVDVSE